VLTVTDPKLGVTTNVYDLKGNLLSTEDAAGNTTSFTYLQSGVRDTMTDALGKVTRYEYAGFTSPTKETDPLGHATNYAYDSNGNRTSQTTTRTLASGATETLTTAFECDLQNRLKKTIYPDGTSTQVVYNSIASRWRPSINWGGRRASSTTRWVG
jgi:YD repeat-containing protein